MDRINHIPASLRFCNIESTVGVSGRVLSERLKVLENEGIDKGQSLKPLMDEIENWSQQWLQEQNE